MIETISVTRLNHPETSAGPVRGKVTFLRKVGDSPARGVGSGEQASFSDGEHSAAASEATRGRGECVPSPGTAGCGSPTQNTRSEGGGGSASHTARPSKWVLLCHTCVWAALSLAPEVSVSWAASVPGSEPGTHVQRAPWLCRLALSLPSITRRELRRGGLSVSRHTVLPIWLLLAYGAGSPGARTAVCAGHSVGTVHGFGEPRPKPLRLSQAPGPREAPSCPWGSQTG